LVHWLATTGGCPAATFLHVPLLFMMLQATQVVLQAVSQQTPWGEQKLDTHSGPVVQGAPLDLPPPQTPFRQTLGDTQSALLLQLFLHMALAPQLNGLHEVWLPG
jgi:hypothetical protein